MASNYKKVWDRQMWAQVAPSPAASVAGQGMCCDLRNSLARNPFIYQLTSATTLYRYNIVTKGWHQLPSPGLGGTFAIGAGMVFVPSFGCRGTLAAGSTTLKVVLSTALATAVGPNMLANRGGSGEYGFRIRITGSSAGGSGKTEERWITGNSSGTTPTIDVDTAFTFTPASGDTYEILAGRLLMFSAGALAATIFRSYEVATNTLASLTNTNLPATIATQFAAVVLDEQYVPYDRKPGEGFLVGAGTYDGGALGCLTATNSASGTLTGQTSAGDYNVAANEYRNFQIRIVEDTAIPTAVGQRRIIASHTGPGSNPVYTLGAAWSVTPSTTAKYVIENPNLLLLQSSASAYWYTYNYTNATINNGTNTIAADAWSTTYFAAPGNAPAVGCLLFPSYGIKPDVSKNARHSYIYRFRGGAANTLDLFDIAGGTTGAWTAGITYDGPQVTTTGSCGEYAPMADEGRFGYINHYVASAINQMYRFDVKNRVLAPYTPTVGWLQSGTAAGGARMSCAAIIDGSDKYALIFLNAHAAANCFEMINLI